MTEHEWLTPSDPHALYIQVKEHLSEEQLRDYACKCCRRIWHLLVDDRSRSAVEVAEKFVASTATNDELNTAHKNAINAYIEMSEVCDDHAAAAAVYCSTPKASMLPAAANRAIAAVESKDTERIAQSDLLRSIIGNALHKNAK
jgi:hypothetical protein